MFVSIPFDVAGPGVLVAVAVYGLGALIAITLVISLIESVRHNSGEFSAQSLRLCIERLWGQQVARESAEPVATLPGRRGDPAIGGPPPA